MFRRNNICLLYLFQIGFSSSFKRFESIISSKNLAIHIMFFKSSVLGDVAPDAHMVDEVGKSESTISIGSLNVRFNMELKQRGNVFAVMSST